jgi:hypothetical protein
MKKFLWSLPVVALGLAGFQQWNASQLPENIARSIAQVEEEVVTVVSSKIAESIREITMIQSQLDRLVTQRDALIVNRDGILERLEKEALTEEEVLELDAEEIALSEQIELLDGEISEARARQTAMTNEIEQKEAERELILCQGQTRTSQLEKEIQGLLSDKEEVASRILNISDDLAELRGVMGIDSKERPRATANVEVAQEQPAMNQFDMSMILSAITSLAQSLQFSLMNTQQSSMPGMMPSGMNPFMQPMQGPMNPWYMNNPIYYQRPYNFFPSPYQVMNTSPYTQLGGMHPPMQQFQSPQVQQQQQQQQPQQQTVVPMGNRQISSDASYFTF